MVTSKVHRPSRLQVAIAHTSSLEHLTVLITDIVDSAEDRPKNLAPFISIKGIVVSKDLQLVWIELQDILVLLLEELPIDDENLHHHVFLCFARLYFHQESTKQVEDVYWLNETHKLETVGLRVHNHDVDPEHLYSHSAS